MLLSFHFTGTLLESHGGKKVWREYMYRRDKVPVLPPYPLFPSVTVTQSTGNSK